MASNQSTIAARPLSTMKRLSPFVYFYEPGQTVTQQPVPPAGRSPRLILIASWMDARDLHIDKYITQYQTIYPTSTILLVRFVFKESLFESVVNTAVEPAFAYLQSKIESGALSASPTHPEILVVRIGNSLGTHRTQKSPFLLFVNIPSSIHFQTVALQLRGRSTGYSGLKPAVLFHSMQRYTILARAHIHFRPCTACSCSAFQGVFVWSWHHSSSPLSYLSGSGTIR